MKRAISIICAVSLLIAVLCLVGCSANIDGSYKLVEITEDGEDVSGQLGNAIITLEVKGKTATLSGTKDLTGEDSLTLTVDTEKKTMADETGTAVPYTVEGNKLTLESSGNKMVFEK